MFVIPPSYATFEQEKFVRQPVEGFEWVELTTAYLDIQTLSKPALLESSTACHPRRSQQHNEATLVRGISSDTA